MASSSCTHRRDEAIRSSDPAWRRTDRSVCAVAAAMERSPHSGGRRGIRRASWAHGGREEVELSGAGVVPHEVEGPGAGGDALVVVDPPGSVFPAGFRRAVRVEGSGGYLQRCPEAGLVWLGQEQDVV